MKKLKCTSCGGKVTVDPTQEYATCDYCGTKYKLNEDINVNIKLDENVKETFNEGMKHVGKFGLLFSIPAIIIGLIAIIIIVTIAIKMIDISSSSHINDFDHNQITDEKSNEMYEETKEKIENIINQESPSIFNMKYEMYSGKQSSFFLDIPLNNVITNNQKNKEKQITVVFEDKSTTDVNEIVNIQNSLTKSEYTVLYEYDDEGYINKLILR